MTLQKPGHRMIRTDLRPGDVGVITAAHGTVYAAEYGWDVTFEAYVAEHLARFAQRAPQPRERIWIAEDDGRFAGCIAIVESTAGTAQLRWFLVHPDARRTGLGTRLMTEAMAFTRAADYTDVFLDTVSILTDAARLYAAAGFNLESEHPHDGWGAHVTAQRYRASLR